MDVILATRNPSKAKQIQQVFDGSPLRILTLDEAGVDGEAVEDGATLEENALKKALYAHGKAAVKTWAMADDTGIFIDALNSAPGVYSARWLGDIPTEAITQGTLEHLVGCRSRTATFRTMVALVSPNGLLLGSFEGAVPGHILTSPRCPPQPKMPYSGIFVPNGQEKCWAEMSVEEENKISHRGIAFRRAREFLEKQIR